MNAEDRTPTGLTRRRRRLSDEETAERMLQTAMEAIAESGLTVSLEHLSLEDVIRSADVSRSAAYRRWPYKDLFFADLLRRLASSAGEGMLPEDTATGQLLARVAREHADEVTTAEGRHHLLVELLRQSAPSNFDFFRRSRQWRTYHALHATFLSLPEGELRDDVQAALARSEQQVMTAIASTYRRLAELLGYRLRPELASTYASMSAILNSTMRGLTLLAPTIESITAPPVRTNAFGSGEEREWSQPALAIAATVMSFLEPDPDAEWDDDRVAATRERLRHLDLADSAPGH